MAGDSLITGLEPYYYPYVKKKNTTFKRSSCISRDAKHNRLHDLIRDHGCDPSDEKHECASLLWPLLGCEHYPITLLCSKLLLVLNYCITTALDRSQNFAFTDTHPKFTRHRPHHFRVHQLRNKQQNVD